MKALRHISLLVLICLLLAGIAHATSGSLSIDVTTNGGCEGAYFDLTAIKENITITGFETVLVGTANVSVYYKPGTYQGFETNAAAWTLLGSQTITGGSGLIQTLYPLAVGGVTIPAGQTVGFLIYSSSSGGSGSLATRYATELTLTVSNSDLTFSAGSGDCGGSFSTPFDGFFANRAWRGTVIYGDPPPATAPETPRPGPDMVPIPAGSVVGKFVTTTTLYYAPDFAAVTYPPAVMDAGKTLWVIGTDKSVQFYQVLLSGTFYWVPVETVGPNDDSLWRNTPLPTQIVASPEASSGTTNGSDRD